MKRPLRLASMAMLLVLANCASIGALAGADSTELRRDSCNWSGSGLNQSRDSVVPVYLGCEAGTVRWSYPRGALRVVLKGPEPEFEACLTLSRRSGALAYVEAADGLLPAPTSSRSPRCYTSREGIVAVYVESRSAPIRRRVMTLTYTVGRARPRRLAGPSSGECRPCTETELREEYCTSDFVAEAVVKETIPDAERHWTHFRLFVSQNHRNYLPDLVSKPRRCGHFKTGSEPLLVMARWHLGHAMVTCAPRLSQWQLLTSRSSLPRCSKRIDDARFSSMELSSA
ncbi:hypothetical protein HPB47_005820 [Ixodes persulcatus]|uniref:Uncharacterized protein n=1 Tax=Ixodes persulcatus TaxID=34615 RepID=A0AC60PCD0_IXOPE|nr:hypothetical protein HPB47_005820 [Ixodes persulcatus]